MIGATKQKIIQLHDWSNLKQKILNSIIGLTKHKMIG